MKNITSQKQQDPIMFHLLLTLLILISGALSSAAQRSGNNNSAHVYRDQVEPHWLENENGVTDRFWYRNDLPNRGQEFIFVNAATGTRERAFDHAAVAEQIGGEADATHLPVDELRYGEDGETLRLLGNGSSWELNLATGVLSEVEGDVPSDQLEGIRAEQQPRPSSRTGPETQITFRNELNRNIEVFWMDSSGSRQSYGAVEAGDTKVQHTFGGHVWLVTEMDGSLLGVFEAEDDGGVAIIDGTRPQERQGRGRGRGQGRGASNGNPSPDGEWNAIVQNKNVVLQSADGGIEVVQLSDDGTDGNGYERLEWSPDSRHLIAWRVERPERKEVYLVRSSPEDGGRAELQTRNYTLPGDEFPKYELNIFDIKNRELRKPEVDRFEHEWLSPSVHWWPGTSRFAYTQEDRGHQRYRLIDVNALTGEVRNLIDEQTDTFIWTTHMEGPERLGIRIVTYLDDSREVIHASEQDGWRHLYLIDGETGELKNQITNGEWVVRGIDRIDEENRQIWFQASGMNPDQDPYLLHFYRINFDGTGLVALTDGNGNHEIEYSPDGRYLVDRYSRVDLPPVTELRQTSDGQLVCQLEEADISELVEQRGFQTPEVFSAKGRDGETDIWGIIVRPADFDPSKKYPIIEDIYAGPHDSFVPKSFSTSNRYQSLTDAGFIVVKVDGMGTANRSKAFHDVIWKNIKDAGFPDRIAWMKAAAEKYPHMDISRVGVYGTSAGGQNAAGALLFHPEFYTAGVANCGCHDNRMDKASWNEQWMGYLPGDEIWKDTPENWYSLSSNIDNAHRLQGHLFLVVGELDTNVPPESTYRFVDALIKADKDFDFLVVPNGGHGSGGSYYRRRMEDFFIEHLQGTPPPNHNGATPGGR